MNKIISDQNTKSDINKFITDPKLWNEIKSPAADSKETCGTCFFTTLMRTATSGTESLWIWNIKPSNIRSNPNNIILDPIRFISDPNKWSTKTVDAQLSSSSKFWILVHAIVQEFAGRSRSRGANGSLF